jgi:hypothetical protein
MTSSADSLGKTISSVRHLLFQAEGESTSLNPKSIMDSAAVVDRVLRRGSLNR